MARLLTLFAQSGTVMAIGWQVYNLARLTMGIREASFQLGLIGLAQFLPLVGCTLISGLIADRVDRRRVALGAVLLQLACTIGLAALVLSGSRRLGAYFILAPGLGVFRAFYMPAMQAILPNLLPPQDMPRGVAASAMAGRVGAILGPAVCGFLYASSPASPFIASAVILCISATCIVLLPPVDLHVGTSGQGMLTDLVAGFRYVRGQPVILGAITLDLVAVLLGGMTALLPAFARDVLHVGATGLGLLRGAPAFGALGATILLTIRPLRSNVGTKMLAAVAVYGVGVGCFGVSRSLPLSVALLVLTGWADMVSVYVRQMLVQLTTPNTMRGRVGSISTLSVSASNELGEAESGLLAFWMGPAAAVVTGGVCAVVVSVLWSRWFPQIRSVDRFPGAATRT